MDRPPDNGLASHLSTFYVPVAAAGYAAIV